MKQIIKGRIRIISLIMIIGGCVVIRDSPSFLYQR